VSYGRHAYAAQLHSIESLLERGSNSGGFMRRLLGPSPGSLIRKLRRKYADRFADDDDEGLTLEDAQSQLESATLLALKLMKDGSYQVDFSDEGLMNDGISECLKPVIDAVKPAGGDKTASP